MPSGFQQLSTLNPQQQQFQSQYINQLQGIPPQLIQYLTQLLSGESGAADAFSAPYLRQFERETVPGIAERFGGSAGSHGALSSGGLNQSLAQAGTDLQTNLAQLRAQLQQGASSQLQSLLNPAFQSTVENIYQPPSQSFFQSVAPGLAQGLGSALGYGLAGPVGGFFGGAAGNFFGGGQQGSRNVPRPGVYGY